MSDKTYTVGGTSIKNGTRTWRFANGTPEARAKVLLNDNHTEVNLLTLPKAMERDEAIAWLKAQGHEATDPPKTAPQRSSSEPRAPKLPRTERAAREGAVAASVQGAEPIAAPVYLDLTKLDRDRDGQLIMPNRGKRGDIPNPHFFLVRDMPGVQEWIAQHHHISKVEDGYVYVHDGEFAKGGDHQRSTQRLKEAMKALGLQDFVDMRSGKWKGPTLSDEVVQQERARLDEMFGRNKAA